MKLLRLISILLLSLFWLARVSLAVDLPQPTGYVNDFAGLFSAGFRQELEADLQALEEETTAEVAVVTIETLGDSSLEEYTVDLFAQWGIGKEDEDNGLLILIAEKERQIRLEVGYGLEPVITDGRAGRIIREQMTPAFKEGDYEAGVKAAVSQIEAYVVSGQSPAGEDESATEGITFLPAFFAGALFLIYISSFWARSKRIWPGGVVGGALGGVFGLITGTLAGFFLFALGLGLLGLFLDFLLSKNYRQLKKAGKPTGFWRSWGGFSSGRSGGFGGFSGGSSGGGGASGGW